MQPNAKKGRGLMAVGPALVALCFGALATAQASVRSSQLAASSTSRVYGARETKGRGYGWV